MKKILSILLLATLMVSLVGCGALQEKELTNIGEYEGCKLELGTAETFTSEDGKHMLRVSAVYTNENADPMYAYCSFTVRAFQNDKQINDCSNINGSEDSLIRGIKNGQSLEVSYVFEFFDESEVEILIGTPTADIVTVGRQCYLSKEE